MTRSDVPTSSNAILDRLNEISFNATMLRELGALALISRLIGEGQLNPAAAGLKALRVHSIADDASLAAYSVSSKLNADWEFLQLLRRKGWEAAERWIATDFPHVGERSTFTPQDMETRPQIGPLAPTGRAMSQADAAD